ncbi:MAG: ribosome maturation factor RimM [Clostridiales Family XIII bacterium]|nr:ribosome maturation factor RimM [Clostridiales Family XIII bacterium]
MKYCNKINIGKISGVFGVKGELKLFHYSGERERIAGMKELFLHSDEGMRRMEVESLRYSGKTPILKLAGTDDRNAAESYIGAEVFVLFDRLVPPEEGRYYVADLIGLRVEDERGEYLGDAAEIIDNPAHDILRVTSADGDWMLPMVDVFVLSVDTEAGRIEVRVPDGLIPEKRSTEKRADAGLTGDGTGAGCAEMNREGTKKT